MSLVTGHFSYVIFPPVLFFLFLFPCCAALGAGNHFLREVSGDFVVVAEFQRVAFGQGYLAVTCYSCEDAIREVRDYLKLP